MTRALYYMVFTTSGLFSGARSFQPGRDISISVDTKPHYRIVLKTVDRSLHSFRAGASKAIGQSDGLSLWKHIHCSCGYRNKYTIENEPSLHAKCDAGWVYLDSFPKSRLKTTVESTIRGGYSPAAARARCFRLPQ